jgi:hypothetical protein
VGSQISLLVTHHNPNQLKAMENSASAILNVVEQRACPDVVSLSPYGLQPTLPWGTARRGRRYAMRREHVQER